MSARVGHGFRAWLAFVLASALGASVIVGRTSAASAATAASAASGCALQPTVVPRPSGVGVLSGVDALSRSDAWAVGRASLNPATYHWNGGGWARIDTPRAAGRQHSGLDAVSARAPDDVWAVGYGTDVYYQDYTPFAAHWNGSAWVRSHMPAGPALLTDVKALAADDVWSVGDTQDPIGGVIEHWDGRVWSNVAAAGLSHSALRGIDGVASDDLWAVGRRLAPDGLTNRPIAVHWDGSFWSVVQVPSPPQSAALTGVDALASDDVWAVGILGRSGDGGFAEHWDGSTWSLVRLPSGSYALNGVAALGPVDVWAGGSTLPTSSQHSYLLHWDGGSWERVPTPRPPQARTMEILGLAGDQAVGLWAVGDYVEDPVNPAWLPMAFHGC